MAAGPGAVRELQSRLSRAEGPAEILKVLELLQDLDISLDILVETGIGKTVNSFRKHATAGNVAKSLVRKWKKLIPPENQRGRKQNTEEDETKSSVSKEVKPSEKSRTSVLASQSSSSSSVSRKLNKQHNHIEKDLQIRDSKEHDNRKCPGSGSKHTCQENSPQAKKSVCKERDSKDSKGAPEKQHSCVAAKDSFPKRKKPKDVSKQRDPKIVEKSEEKCAVRSETELPGGEEFEPPTKSFESYLNYDQVTKKRKRKSCSVGEHPKKCSEQKSSSQPQRNSKFSHTNEGGEKVQNSADDQSETPSKKGAIMASLLTWQQVKETLTDVLLVTSSEPVVEAPQQVSEIVQFTGRRLNSKMQVYSGSKPVCLSKMLTLYELCIRVLQNNIDFCKTNQLFKVLSYVVVLHEVGGVPFEILEPVLMRCTPEQLFRVEECNPVNSALLNSGNHRGDWASVCLPCTPFGKEGTLRNVIKNSYLNISCVETKTFTEESDHLWKKHCQRDFKNESLLEYECWREMYLRLFNEREEKLKMLTKNILSAQSEKPKGNICGQLFSSQSSVSSVFLETYCVGLSDVFAPIDDAVYVGEGIK
ncbi:hypothetical protein ASZ78_016243 [Callipepla squamata]|uniref:TFIIS N-terminal domain-containing protein n=1 Tax=Callipepla squamata TaxID=9009 RepID=A0A226N6T5_CALSU|nr:hypothetical protein ASZ78_016243 [Callipepla squamata]